MQRQLAAAACLLPALLIGPRAESADESLTAEQLEFFESKIRPILVENCYSCHSTGAKNIKGELVLDSKAGWMRGGESGRPAILPGNPKDSRLLRAVSYEDPDLQMPPRNRLGKKEIADLGRWIEMGAPDPRDAPTRAPEKESFDLEARRRAHWAWQSIRDPMLPRVRNGSWPRSSVDRFILARLEAAGLQPAAEAPKRTWLRRVTFDLIGLPPTAAEIEQFISDESPGARELVVKRLLDSPHYGEKWAQHWLDLVRYAETRGHEQDFAIPLAFRYRDYCVRSFNLDVPYDVFVREHIAGDLVSPSRIHPEEKTNESIQGTGFWHLGEATHSPVDIRGDEAGRVANQIDVFGKTFLALTLGCARCHDHKFDAISTSDYYSLYGFLQSSSSVEADVADPEAQRVAHERLVSLERDRGPEILRLHGERLKRRLVRVSDYLVAAGEVVRGAEAAAVSKEGDLSPERLNAWTEHLRGPARKVAGDPFFAFAEIAARKNASNESFAETKRAILDHWRDEATRTRQRFGSKKTVATREEGERNYVRTENALREEDGVVDLRSGESEHWIVSGHRFGKGPARPGQVVWSSDVEHPVAHLLEEGAAHADLLSERFTGMFRTQTFEVTSDTLWYRLRGEVDVFLAVDSHRVISGPLHGVVKRPIKGKDVSEDYRWYAHNVRDYIGHRVHVEFRPKKGFSLSRIQFYNGEPPGVFRASEALVELLEDDSANSPAAVAARYQKLLEDAVDALATARLPEHDDAAEVAKLVNWLLKHDDLLEAATSSDDSSRAAFEAFLVARASIEKEIPKPVLALVMLDGSGENEPVHIRGSHNMPSKERVQRGLLTAFRRSDEPPLKPGRGSGRLKLARRLTAGDNPLVARVIVNRIWHHVFGRGIVSSVDDFGVMGEEPSHPELLDHLATKFRAEWGWSIKTLIRELVLSSIYRMSSRPSSAGDAVDPTNALLHRMRIRRLTGEQIRDAILAISGRLDRRVHGKSVKVHVTPFMRGNRSPGGSGPADGNGRRSLYVEVRRNHLSHFLTAFDKPVPFATIGKRGVSNSPAQPLILLNDEFVHKQAELWAKRLVEGNAGLDRIILVRAYVEAFGRVPESWEVEAARGFIREGLKEQGEKHRISVWKDLFHVLFNVKEFVFIN